MKAPIANLAVHHDVAKGVVVLEYASEGHVVSTGRPYSNRYISVLRRFQSRWRTMLITLPSGARTKNRRTPHGSVVIGFTIS